MAPGETLDLVGVGIGPANLSLAALAHRVRGLRTLFFDEKPEFRWHPGLLFPEAMTQIHFLKDLVTPVDPTSPFSFLAFLVATKRFYRAIILNRPRATRLEFDEYYRWAAASLPSLVFSCRVEHADWDGSAFVVEAGEEGLRARNLVVATGRQPRVPEFMRPLLSARVFHAADFLLRPRFFSGRSVAVIGGGQTGADVIYHLLSDGSDRPARLLWVTRRSNFLPLDESAFTKEMFMPNHSRFFYGLPEDSRLRLIEEYKLATDGITGDLLTDIHRRLYDLEFLLQAGRFWEFLPAHELIGAAAQGGRLRLMLRNLPARLELERLVDTVILATGYEYEYPSALRPLLGRLSLPDGRMIVQPDFSIAWDGPAENRIYVQGAAEHAYGVADPNLSLLAWRSATIINGVVGRQVYDVGDVESSLAWSGSGGALDAAGVAGTGAALSVEASS